eukprot:CAMPEP_0168334214 /NCGR_PEP_ID=MMETSP0213-20121227/10123_1 /TAXON_ID=151035 /ORGANISM="Euplotes harpa, Strain FSP1.4" /LENGTH=224 /DNA_ID=CAMNT_0008338793 /DNA_START=42 /DNA_END=717 /DNA_ORIENTATION=+
MIVSAVAAAPRPALERSRLELAPRLEVGRDHLGEQPRAVLEVGLRVERVQRDRVKVVGQRGLDLGAVGADVLLALLEVDQRLPVAAVQRHPDEARPPVRQPVVQAARAFVARAEHEVRVARQEVRHRGQAAVELGQGLAPLALVERLELAHPVELGQARLAVGLVIGLGPDLCVSLWLWPHADLRGVELAVAAVGLRAQAERVHDVEQLERLDHRGHELVALEA